MLDLLRQRLHNQKLVRPGLKNASQIVSWLGAVQSQDYPGAKWGLALRSTGLDDAAIDRAFDAGEILRTHVMRPTWHFVTPADIRWLLALTASRVHATCASYYRTVELDDKTFTRSRLVFERALAGGRHLTRAELVQALRRARIPVSRLRVIFMIMSAELAGAICSGPRRGKDLTYALLDERVPPAPTLQRDEALARLTERYFASHGPATIKDFAWWSGLTVADAKRGVEMCKPRLREETFDGRSHFFVPARRSSRVVEPAYLLPNYDEYVIAYKDRDHLMPPSPKRRPPIAPGALFVNSLMLDGQLAGSWRRTPTSDAVVVTLTLSRRCNDAELEAVKAAAERYRRFLKKPVSLRIRGGQHVRRGRL